MSVKNFLLYTFIFGFFFESLTIAQTPVSYADLGPEMMLPMLIERRDAVRKRAFYCPGPDFKGQMSLEKWNCAQGDLPIFAGINCLSARIAKDLVGIKFYCSNVRLSQDKNGRYWRGQSNIGNMNTKPATFSKDQALGVLSYAVGSYYWPKGNFALNERKDIISELTLWATYIEQEEGGKFLCEKRQLVGNPCKIFQGKGFAATLKRVLESTTVLNNLNPEWKLVSKLKLKSEKFSWNKFRRELLITPAGFQTHLKSIIVLLNRALDFATGKRELEDHDYEKLAKRLFKRDERNPWHYLMYHGVDAVLFEKVLQDYCPANLPSNSYETTTHSSDGYSWQDKRNRTGWESANGHDCIFLLNMMIADLNGSSPLLYNHKKDSQCSINHQDYLGNLGSSAVCEKRNKVSYAKCEKKGGSNYYLQDKKFHTREDLLANQTGEWGKINFDSHYCLVKEKESYAAYEIDEYCPSLRSFEGFWDWENSVVANNGSYSPKMTPICSGVLDKKVPEFRCHKKEGSFYWLNPINGVRYCMVNKGAFLIKKELAKKTCPIFSKKIGEKQGWQLPLCESWASRSIELSECLKKSNFEPENGYCLYSREGYFKVRKIAERSFGPEPVRPEFQTQVINWIIEDKDIRIDRDKTVVIDHQWNVSGKLKWFTSSDRKGDQFLIKFFFRKSLSDSWEEIDAQDGEERLIEVLHDRHAHFSPYEVNSFNGNYEYNYQLIIPFEAPETQVKYEIYLLKYDEEGKEVKVLELEQQLLSRGGEFFKSFSLFPSPISRDNVHNLNLKYESFLLSASQLEQFQLELQLSIVGIDGRVIAQGNRFPLELQQTGMIDLNSAIDLSSLTQASAGIYILKMAIFADKVFTEEKVLLFQVF